MPATRLVDQDDEQAGYTLTEMLVVIGIIGLIAAALTPGIIGQFSRAKAKAAQLQLQTIVADVEAFSSDVQRYPTQQEGLQALLREPAGVEGWSGPYVRDRRMLNDPWGRPILYSVDAEARSFSLKSLGADGKPGGSGVDRDLQAPELATTAAEPAQARPAAPAVQTSAMPLTGSPPEPAAPPGAASSSEP